jgi:hypothetical protein
MKLPRISVGVTVAILCATLAWGAPHSGEIRFRLAQGFGIIVRGGIGPMDDLNFLLDTGAVPSALSQRVASRIGVKGAAASLTLLDKDIQALYVMVDEVRLGSVRAAGLPMVVVDLTRIEGLLGTRIDAIVGLDILARQNFSIDYKHGRIRLGLSGSPRHEVSAEIHTASGAPYWVLPITLGSQSLSVLLDTGADHLALFAGHTPKPDLAAPDIISAKPPGEVTERALRPLPLIMGDMRLREQRALVLKEPSGSLRKIDGVLGPTALGITRIEFDWEHKCLRWNKE